MKEKTVEELRKELEETCIKTETSLNGMLAIKEYYTQSLGWSERKAIEYCITLFDKGTIEKIKLFGKDGKEIC